MASLSLREVCKSYRLRHEQTLVLSRVCLELKKGERLAIKGPSGSGKTSLLNCAALLDTIDGGSIHFDDKRIDHLTELQKTRFRAENFGFIFQDYHLLTGLSVIQNVLLPIMLNGSFHSNHQKKALGLLDRLGIAEYSDRSVTKLSGGQRQRVAIARSLINDPKIIFADEPSANLDRKSTGVVIGLLLEMTDFNGASLLVCTHDDELASRMDRVTQLEDLKKVHENEQTALS